MPGAPAAQPILFVANHTNWWDGFIAYLVATRMGLHVHVLMEAVNLDRYWMFKLVGALPVRRNSAPAAYADLAQAARHLRRPVTGMWIFPQGTRSSPDVTTSGKRPGAMQLTCTPNGAHSRAWARVKPASAVLAVV